MLWGKWCHVFSAVALGTVLLTGQTAPALGVATITAPGHRADAASSNDWVDEELQIPCVANASLPGCATFTYPAQYAAQDLASLCTQMPFMPTCTLLAACNSASAAAPVSATNQRTCDPVNLLATACKLDGMSGMHACTGYNALCANSSSVRQCDADGGVATLPTTDTANKMVRSICSEMSMDGCEECTPDWQQGKKYAACDLLTVYARLCVEMPAMDQCAAFSAMCTADASLYLCPGGSGGFHRGPSMLMYFNAQLPFYLLFKEWTPGGPGQGQSSYLAAWFAIFALGMTLELLQVLKSRMEVVWARDARERSDRRRTSSSRGGGGGGGSGDAAHKAPPELAPQRTQARPASRSPLLSYRLHWEDVGRAGMTLVTMGVAYLLMLSAMSFNTGIFFAVILGVAMGTLLFGQFRSPSVLNGSLTNAHSNDMACCTGV